MQKYFRIGMGTLLSVTFSCQIQAADGGDSQSDLDSLEKGFEQPPQDARPRVWWHWINGNISAEGARLDLLWMQRVGIGGVHAFTGALPGPVVVKDRIPFLSPKWDQVFDESVVTAGRAGMEFGIAGSPGWSETGGPWVAPEDGMKKYVWSETRIKNGQPFAGILTVPAAVTGPFQSIKSGQQPDFYRDSYVIAFPTPKPERKSYEPNFTASAHVDDLTKIFDDDYGSAVVLPLAEGEGSAWVEARFPANVTLAAISLGLPSGGKLEVQASAKKSRDFRTLVSAVLRSWDAEPKIAHQQTISFPATTGKVFRVRLTPVAAEPGLRYDGNAPPVRQPARSIPVSFVKFDVGARVNRFEAKAGFQPSLEADSQTPPVPSSLAIPASGVLDLTKKLRQDGTLDWAPPAGDWTVIRLGWSLTGQTNGPADPEATGLEVDKLDATAVKRYLTKYLSIYEKALGGDLTRNGVNSLITDSWEAGVQNWTPDILGEFRRLRGYDPVPYLPVLAGRVVQSAEQSDRFLWDFRETLKELVANNHHRVLADMLHAKGVTYYSEAQGDTPRAIADGMTLKARADIPTAEYWYRPFAAGPGQYSLKADLEEAASVAHVYGKPFAAAEALTVAALTDPWSFSPRMLKPVADEIFARGINRLLLHDSHHQPLVDAKPGLMLSIFGQSFNRNETWANDAKPWVDYLSRTSFLLQQGKYVADVAYFYGEEKSLTEQFIDQQNQDVPAGYKYDYINPEALLTLLSVKDGEIITPSGMHYKLLLLPPQVRHFSLPVLLRIRELTAQGAVLVGSRPLGGLGNGSPDREISAIANEMWGAEESGSRVRAFRKGKIYSDVSSAFSGEGISPDFIYSNAVKDGDLLTLHRRTDAADIYYVSNQADKKQVLAANYRVTGKLPMLWRPETGLREPLAFRQESGRTIVSLDLQPLEAAFVVFEGVSREYERLLPAVRNSQIADLSLGWDVSFEPKRGAPPHARFETLSSWTQMPDPGIRYFSGAATYRRAVNLSRAELQSGKRYTLHLGQVYELAAVTVNGTPVGTAWHAPYDLDVTEALRIGRNSLEIRVVNLWPNRLIGDKQPNATAVAFAPQSPYRRDSALLPSGLIGPVTLSAADEKASPAPAKASLLLGDINAPHPQSATQD